MSVATSPVDRSEVAQGGRERSRQLEVPLHCSEWALHGGCAGGTHQSFTPNHLLSP